MEWFLNLLKDPASIAHIVVVYAAVISIGVKLGKIKFGGVALGVTFVLFAGIVAGHIFNQFLKLFVYCNTIIQNSGILCYNKIRLLIFQGIIAYFTVVYSI
ncbi:MAG: hypothetical protein IIW61_05320, partial [Bacteroidaceae bacterium]|nr:hypothetical protein [Bacteroidaceae bacterium]